MNQSQFLATTCNSPEAREKSRVHGAIGFGFASHWLKNWRESFEPITKRSNHNHVITFGGQTFENCSNAPCVYDYNASVNQAFIKQRWWVRSDEDPNSSYLSMRFAKKNS